MKKILKVIIFAGAVFLSGYLAYESSRERTVTTEASVSGSQTSSFETEEEENAPVRRSAEAVIGAGKTYIDIMESQDIGYGLAMEIYEASKNAYDLAKIREGKKMIFYFDDQSNSLEEINYKIDSEEELFIKRTGAALISSTSPPEWSAEVKPIPYEIRIKALSAEIKTSMYQAAVDNGIDIRAVIELANAFQWTIDFAMDPRAGDSFAFVLEERYLDGKYEMPGRVLAGKYVNAGQDFYVYHFEESDENKGYFDPDGNSVQKMFLKAPVEFKYISSGFTTGLRYIEAFDISTGHRAVDYAAAQGTPIRSVGDGTVTFAGWNSQGYGNMVSVRHNNTYSTNYAHQSKIAVKKGQKVKQGDIIGYVGSTGLSTGPHLHYEMVKNGAKINPLKEVLPPGEPIKGENRERFFAEVEKYKKMLEK